MDFVVVDDLQDELGAFESSLVVRTDFSDEAAWVRTQTSLMQPGQLGEDAGDDGGEEFGPSLTFVDHPRFDGFTPEQLVAEARRQGLRRNHLFIADHRAQSVDEHAVVVVDLEEQAPVGEANTLGRSFRAVPFEVGSIGVNLSLRNMDFRDFADVADVAPDGVFRGFAE